MPESRAMQGLRWIYDLAPEQVPANKQAISSYLALARKEIAEGDPTSEDYTVLVNAIMSATEYVATGEKTSQNPQLDTEAPPADESQQPMGAPADAPPESIQPPGDQPDISEAFSKESPVEGVRPERVDAPVSEPAAAPDTAIPDAPVGSPPGGVASRVVKGGGAWEYKQDRDADGAVRITVTKAPPESQNAIGMILNDGDKFFNEISTELDKLHGPLQTGAKTLGLSPLDPIATSERVETPGDEMDLGLSELRSPKTGKPESKDPDIQKQPGETKEGDDVEVSVVSLGDSRKDAARNAFIKGEMRQKKRKEGREERRAERKE